MNEETAELLEKCLEDAVFQELKAEQLHKALTELTPEQRRLIEKIYFKEEKQTDITRELGIDKTSLRDRLKVIYKKLKKFL